jgi:hypothetical protein
MSYVVKFFLTFTFSFDYRPTMIRAIYVSIISVSVTLFFPFAPIVITNMQFWPPLSWHYFLRKTVNTVCILYNYIEETRLQSIYQFSDHTTYARRLPFLPSTVIYFIPKCLSFMVLLMSNRPDDSIGAPWQQVMVATNSQHQGPDYSTAQCFHYSTAATKHSKSSLM